MTHTRWDTLRAPEPSPEARDQMLSYTNGYLLALEDITTSLDALVIEVRTEGEAAVVQELVTKIGRILADTQASARTTAADLDRLLRR